MKPIQIRARTPQSANRALAVIVVYLLGALVGGLLVVSAANADTGPRQRPRIIAQPPPNPQLPWLIRLFR